MKMNQLPVKAYSSDLFTFGVSRKFISEASTINMENFEPLYNDSNDCGLAIKSEKTGVVVRYVVSYIDRFQGEITKWVLIPTSESEKEVPGCVGTTVTIFND